MNPSLTYTRAGEAVTSLEPHKGLIRGKVESGATRYWYPDGRMTPLRAGHSNRPDAIERGEHVGKE